ncbi:hypothetical protein [Bradyrhizobium sp. 166]|uniref:hypothetical protein n=1 Tax=Bradyrhizobium sp. 166 TaxID=2782638 RepID=UPI001FF87521|nr:hypothetical protein [Bradyrhizobium sp. 166]
MSAKREGAVFQLIDDVGQLAKTTLGVGGPIGDVRFLAGGLANDAKAQRVKG